VLPWCDARLAEVLDGLAGKRIRHEDVVAGPMRALPGLLGDDEQVLDMAEAYRRTTAGLLVMTDRRVLWVTPDEEPWEVALASLVNAHADREVLELYWEGGMVKLNLDPREAAEWMAGAIRERRTVPAT
jgi:hypothetical protein